MPRTNPRTPSYVYVTYINTTPQRLWRALLDPALIRQYWMGRENTSTWRKGAALVSRSPDGESEWHGRIVAIKPLRRLVYTFQLEGRDEPETRVTFEIDPLKNDPVHRGRGLRLTVTHGGYAPGSWQFKGVSRGWPAILSGLKSLLETGRALGITYVG